MDNILHFDLLELLEHPIRRTSRTLINQFQFERGLNQEPRTKKSVKNFKLTMNDVLKR